MARDLTPKKQGRKEAKLMGPATLWFQEHIQDDIRDLRQSQEKGHQFLNHRIDDVQRTLTDRLDTQTRDLTAHFDTGIETIVGARAKDADRISSLEKWRWIIGGGSVVVGVIILDMAVRIFEGPIAQFVVNFYKH